MVQNWYDGDKQTFGKYDVSCINFESTSDFKTKCPSCEDCGNDHSGDNLHVYKNNGGCYCWACNFAIPSEEKILKGDVVSNNSFSGKSIGGNNTVRSKFKKTPKDFESKKLTQDKILEIEKKTVDNISVMYRGLQRYNSISMKEGIRYELDSDGQVQKMYVPVYYNDGTNYILTGYRVRVVEPKDFYIDGFCSVSTNEWIGKKSSPKIADTLIIVGGEVDYVTTKGAINDLMTKYKTHSINVVSTISGESSVVESIKSDYDWVVAHKKIILALDNDEAGWKAINDALQVLPSEQCYTANFGEFKDPNEYRLDSHRLCQDIYWNAQPVDDFGYVGADELFDEGLKVLHQEKIKLPYFLKDLANFFVDGEIARGEWINIIAATSAGKSTIIDAWKDAWIDICPYKQAVNSFEASAGRYGIKEVSAMVGKSVSHISGKDNRISFYEQQRERYLDRVIGIDGKPKFYFVSKIPKSIEQFKKMLLRLVKVEGVGVLWIDPALSLKAMCSDFKEFDNLLVWIDQVIRLEFNTLIVTVQHTRKNLSSGKNASQGGELAEEDGEGSRMLISLATINIGVERNKEAEFDVERNTTLLSLFKNRPDQRTGRHIAKLFYRAKANRLYPYSDALTKNFFSDDDSLSVMDITDDGSYSLVNITDNIDDYEKVDSQYIEDDVDLGW